MPENPEYLSVAEAAKWLGVNTSFLNKARLSGKGPVYYKFSASIRYEASKLREWAATRMRHSTSEDAAPVRRGRPRKVDAGASPEVRS